MDVKDSSLIHKSYLDNLVCPGGEYVVLCLGSTEIPKGLLRPFIPRGRGQDEDEDGDGEFEDAEDAEDIDEVI